MAIICAIAALICLTVFWVRRQYQFVPVVPTKFKFLWAQGSVIVVLDDNKNPQEIIKLRGFSYRFASRYGYVFREDGVRLGFAPTVGFLLKGPGWGREKRGINFPRSWKKRA